MCRKDRRKMLRRRTLNVGERDSGFSYRSDQFGSLALDRWNNAGLV
jgi:hypothetical protein